MATKNQRAHLHGLMAFLLAHEPQCNYPRHDVRGPLDAATFALTEAEMRERIRIGGHLMFDCSQSTAQLLVWVGCKGAWLRETYSNGVPKVYTGTMLGHLPHYTQPKNAMVGALVVYGPATGDHVSMVMEPGPDPILWSHGYDGGPVLIRLSAQRAMHRPPVTFLSIAGL